MTSISNNVQPEKRKFHLYEHPWLSLLTMIIAIIVSNILSIIVFFAWLGLSSDSLIGQFALGISYNTLTIFLFAPFVLRLPMGKRTFQQYLNDIGLTRVQPFFRLLLFALSCYAILALSQVAASFVYRLSEGLQIDGNFVRQIFDISKDLPPGSSSLFVSIPSAFEEVVFRGIVLTVFLNKYSKRKSIVFSSLGFGLVHVLNLVNGADFVWVMGQIVWAFIIGLFYGYAFVKTRSLLPVMIVHYLSNAFIGSLTGYLQASASVETQVFYGVIFSFGVIPTILMILWTKFFSSKWLPNNNNRDKRNV
jgi:membrane protease YdiL (CAAX protease family)